MCGEGGGIVDVDGGLLAGGASGSNRMLDGISGYERILGLQRLQQYLF